MKTATIGKILVIIGIIFMTYGIAINTFKDRMIKEQKAIFDFHYQKVYEFIKEKDKASARPHLDTMEYTFYTIKQINN